MLTGFAVPNDKDDGIGLAGEDDAVGDGEDGRRIDDDVAVEVLDAVEQGGHGGGTEHLCGERGYGATCEDVEVGRFGDALDGLFERRDAGEQGGEADLAGEAEAVVDVGTAKIGVDQQNPGFALRENAGEVAGGAGLALGWGGGGEEQNLWGMTGGREQKRGPEGAEGLGEVRLGLCQHADISLCDGETGDLLCRGAARLGDDGERGKLDGAFDLGDAAQTGVKALEQEGDCNSYDQAEECGGEEDGGVGLGDGHRRNLGLIDHVDFDGFEACLDAGGTETVDEAFVEGAVGFEFAGFDGVFDEVIAELVGVALLLIEDGGGLGLVGAGGEVVLLGLLDETLLLGVELPLQLSQLACLGLGERVVGAVGGHQLGIVCLGNRDLRTQGVELVGRGSGGSLDRSADSIGTAAAQHAIAGFGDDAGDAGGTGGAVKILEGGVDGTVFGVEAVDAELLLQVHDLLLRGGDLKLEIFELAGEKLRDALGGGVADFVASLDVIGHHLINNVCREPGVEAAVADEHNLGLWDERDMQVCLKGTDDGLADARVVDRVLGHVALDAEEIRVVGEIQLACDGEEEGIALKDGDLGLHAILKIGVERGGGTGHLILIGSAGTHLDTSVRLKQTWLREKTVEAEEQAEDAGEEQNPFSFAKDEDGFREGGLRTGVGETATLHVCNAWARRVVVRLRCHVAVVYATGHIPGN